MRHSSLLNAVAWSIRLMTLEGAFRRKRLNDSSFRSILSMPESEFFPLPSSRTVQSTPQALLECRHAIKYAGQVKVSLASIRKNGPSNVQTGCRRA